MYLPEPADKNATGCFKAPLLFGWGYELSLLFQWWGQSNMVMLKAVFKVTCLHFELSSLGLIYLL